MKKCDVFTPREVAIKMASYLKGGGSLLEPSVGKGDLLCMDTKKYDIECFDTETSYLECVKCEGVKKYCEDFLLYYFADKKYDNIILNPPYVKYQDLDLSYRKFLKSTFKVLGNGNIDIYLAFLIKCLDLLKDDGVMVSITPSSFLYNK